MAQCGFDPRLAHLEGVALAERCEVHTRRDVQCSRNAVERVKVSWTETWWLCRQHTKVAARVRKALEERYLKCSHTNAALKPGAYVTCPDCQALIGVSSSKVVRTAFIP